VTKLVIRYPPLISGIVKDRAFKFYAELMTEEYNKIYTQDSPKWAWPWSRDSYLNLWALNANSSKTVKAKD